MNDIRCCKESRTNSYTISAVLEFRVPSWWLFAFMRQMIWIIGPAACNVSTLDCGRGFCSVNGLVAGRVHSWLHLLFSQVAEEPWSHLAWSEEWRRAPGIARWWLTAKESLPTGESSPSQREKQASICQITSFTSAAFGHRAIGNTLLGLLERVQLWLYPSRHCTFWF